MRQVDDMTMSSASLENYIDWICYSRLDFSEEDHDKYLYLIKELLDIEFTWSIPRDSNRAEDGLALRRDFTYETDLYLDKSSGILPRCSVFEMLAALAYRCEDQIMLDYKEGHRAYIWFFIMLKNLGLEKCTNSRWNRNMSEYIYDSVMIFVNRKYKSDGSNGGLFPIKNRKINQKEEEIWKQLMAYLNENYE